MISSLVPSRSTTCRARVAWYDSIPVVMPLSFWVGLSTNFGKLLNVNNSRAVGGGTVGSPKPRPPGRVSLRNFFKHGLKRNRYVQIYLIRSFCYEFSAPKNSEFQFKIWKIILKLGKLLQNLGKLKKSASRCRIDSVEASQRRLQTLPTHPPRSRYDSCAFQGSQREK